MLDAVVHSVAAVAVTVVILNNVVVQNWDGRGLSSRYSGTTAKCKLGEVPPGLTHRAVWNACERDQCWACQRQHSPDVPGCQHGIAYVCYACNPSGDLRAAITDSRTVGSAVCPHCGTTQSAERTKWWRNPPLGRRTIRIARGRCRASDAGAGIPRAPQGNGWHAPPSRLDLPAMRGITDQNGDVLQGTEKKMIIKLLTEELRRDAGGAAEDGEPAAGQGREPAAWPDAPPGLRPPGTFRAPPPRPGTRPPPWWNQWSRGESYGRRQSYGSGESYESRPNRKVSSWRHGGESYGRHGYQSGSSWQQRDESYDWRGHGGSSSSWGYSESDRWWQRSSDRQSAPWRPEDAGPAARPYRRREDDEGEDRNVRPRGSSTGAASAEGWTTAASAASPRDGAAADAGANLWPYCSYLLSSVATVVSVVVFVAAIVLNGSPLGGSSRLSQAFRLEQRVGSSEARTVGSAMTAAGDQPRHPGVPPGMLPINPADGVRGADLLEAARPPLGHGRLASPRGARWEGFCAAQEQSVGALRPAVAPRERAASTKEPARGSIGESEFC